MALMLIYQCCMHAQSKEISAAFGVSNYQGDLNPGNTFANSKYTHFSQSISIGYAFNGPIALHLQYTHTLLSASDGDSNVEWRKERNLDFKSPIDELNFNFDLDVLRLIFDKNYKLRPYVQSGVAVFKFNPMANYNGQYYPLHGMSTEGQGLPGSNVKPYYLIDVAIPFGLGIKYALTDHIDATVSTIFRITNTDYLDDVSGAYYDLDEIRKYKGSMAAKLSYRTDEVNHQDISPIYYDQYKRGNPEKNDWYSISSVGISYKFK